MAAELVLWGRIGDIELAWADGALDSRKAHDARAARPKTKPFVYVLGRPPLVCDVLPHLLGQRWAREPLVRLAPCVPAVPFQLTAERRAVPADIPADVVEPPCPRRAARLSCRAAQR